jgi:MFS family permease
VTRQEGRPVLLDMTLYQWTVLFAAWLGWGFDVFDGLLFNFVAPNCVPALLGLTAGTPEARSAALWWTGVISSLLLVGWAVGGILFGRIADRLGRSRTLLLTMAMYSVGTALCAAAPNMGALVAFRVIASLGIGGEWAAGAAMVAEVVPEKRRVEAGALLYTSAPLGLFLATEVTWLIQGVAMRGDPATAWRYVFLAGLLPAAAAFLIRLLVREPERWQRVAAEAQPRLVELFRGETLESTLSGLGTAIVALIMWWSCNAFLPIVATGLAATEAHAQGLTGEAATHLLEAWKATAVNWFNVGGLIGTLATIPISKVFGRKPMFAIYFATSAIAIAASFGLDLPPIVRLYTAFPIGLTVFGVFGSFTYYLPELYPTRLRATGAGFCYNAGRILAAVGPFVVGSVASQGADSLVAALHVLRWVAIVPALGVLFLPWIIETRDRALSD